MADLTMCNPLLTEQIAWRVWATLAGFVVIQGRTTVLGIKPIASSLLEEHKLMGCKTQGDEL
jgi:hypothetical protein